MYRIRFFKSTYVLSQILYWKEYNVNAHLKQKKDKCRKSYIAKHAIITNSRWKILMKIIQSINSWYSDYQNQRAHNLKI